MDLHGTYGPLIEQALTRMAPGETVGWMIDAAVGTAPDQKPTPCVRLFMWTPAPIVGTVIHWQTKPWSDPFLPLANDAALLDEAVSTGLENMRRIASDLLRSTTTGDQ